MPTSSKSTKKTLDTGTDDQYFFVSEPHWFVQKGNLVLAGIFTLLLGLVSMIKYPDSVNGTLKLRAIDAPKLLVARTNGKLRRLMVKNEQRVKEGSLLAYIQSDANLDQVMRLQSWISDVEPLLLKDNMQGIFGKPILFFDELGELQTPYEDFWSSQMEIYQAIISGYYSAKEQAIKGQVDNLQEIERSYLLLKELHRRDSQLQSHDFIASKTLVEEKVKAQLELDQSESKLIAKKSDLSQIDLQLSNNSISLHDKAIAIAELKKLVYDQKQRFCSSLFNLKARIQEWKQKYLIVAPESGKVIFSSFIQANELISESQPLFNIQPDNSSYYGQLELPQAGLGKVKIGQKVIINVQSYPKNEFGSLFGSIAYISAIPSNRDTFLIKVDLPAGLRTNYNRIIEFRNDLLANAEVITDDRRLISRLIGPVLSVYRYNGTQR